MNIQVNEGNLNDEVAIGGDEYISASALILATLATGQSRFSNFSNSIATANLVNYLRSLGIKIEQQGDELLVTGGGMKAFDKPGTPHSVTNLYNLASVLAYDELIADFNESAIKDFIAAGSASIKTAVYSASAKHKREIIYKLTKKNLDYPIKKGDFSLKAVLLFSALFEVKDVLISEAFPSVDHTERLFSYFGISQESWGRYENRITIAPNDKPIMAHDLTIPNDISLAASSIVSAVLADDGYLTLHNMLLNRKRIGFLYTLKAMGADIKIKNRKFFGYEAVGDIVVQGGKPLEGVVVPENIVACMTHELPYVMVAAAHANGLSSFYGASYYRSELSDKWQPMEAQLKALGVEVHRDKQNLEVMGKGNLGLGMEL